MDYTQYLTLTGLNYKLLQRRTITTVVAAFNILQVMTAWKVFEQEHNDNERFICKFNSLIFVYHYPTSTLHHRRRECQGD